MSKKNSYRPDEIKKLESQLAELKSQNEQLKKSARGGQVGKPSSWHKTLVAILLILGLVLAPFSVAAVWLNRQVVDTDAYVNTVGPLSEDPAIQTAVANYVTNQIFTQVNVTQKAKEALPPNAQFLAGPLSENMRGFVNTAVKKVVATDQFNKLWVQANRTAHNALTLVIVPKEGVVSTGGGQVTLNLGELMNQVKAQLRQRGITIFDNVDISGIDKQLVLFQSDTLAQVQSYVTFLNNLAIILPLLSLAFIAGAIALSPVRIRTTFWTGFGLAISMAVLLVALAIAKQYFLNTVISNQISSSAASAFYDTIAATLRLAARGFVLLGLILMLGAYFAGDSARAVQLRSRAINWVQALGAGYDFGKPGDWIANHKMGLRIAGLLIILLLIAFVSQITPLVVLTALIIYLLFLGAIEFFGRAPAHPLPQ
ncbi:MAG: hypothetical protein C4562_00115 [Actinobacteria bacterium]|nr:MAG: hypothetical protein C4562_00115 [Actinomycetota bacterium]